MNLWVCKRHYTVCHDLLLFCSVSINGTLPSAGKIPVLIVIVTNSIMQDCHPSLFSPPVIKAGMVGYEATLVISIAYALLCVNCGNLSHFRWAVKQLFHKEGGLLSMHAC